MGFDEILWMGIMWCNLGYGVVFIVIINFVDGCIMVQFGLWYGFYLS